MKIRPFPKQEIDYIVVSSQCGPNQQRPPILQVASVNTSSRLELLFEVFSMSIHCGNDQGVLPSTEFQSHACRCLVEIQQFWLAGDLPIRRCSLKCFPENLSFHNAFLRLQILDQAALRSQAELTCANVREVESRDAPRCYPAAGLESSAHSVRLHLVLQLGFLDKRPLFNTIFSRSTSRSCFLYL